jgi:hypothetical protein
MGQRAFFVKDKIKLCDCLRWADIKDKFTCFRCGKEYENERAIKRGKDLVCMCCIKEQGIFAVAYPVQRRVA